MAIVLSVHCRWPFLYMLIADDSSDGGDSGDGGGGGDDDGDGGGISLVLFRVVRVTSQQLETH